MPVLQSKTAGAGDAPKQFNQPSRKGKKAWRKNVDVTEVQEGLEELNKEIIQGYGILFGRQSPVMLTEKQRCYQREGVRRPVHSRHDRRLAAAQEIQQAHQEGSQG